ncbi:Ankyrin repeat [Phytophthora nicotianae]|uniref:Ankyrin repeat n=1 Tax=Phytophthora nicotianae TaxID=4792 RepID=A0A0W8DM33_PHYNI|nr:Ankyrin repeat [Phytophthora nicotianae]
MLAHEAVKTTNMFSSLTKTNSMGGSSTASASSGTPTSSTASSKKKPKSKKKKSKSKTDNASPVGNKSPVEHEEIPAQLPLAQRLEVAAAIPDTHAALVGLLGWSRLYVHTNTILIFFQSDALSLLLSNVLRSRPAAAVLDNLEALLANCLSVESSSDTMEAMGTAPHRQMAGEVVAAVRAIADQLQGDVEDAEDIDAEAERAAKSLSRLVRAHALSLHGVDLDSPLTKDVQDLEAKIAQVTKADEAVRGQTIRESFQRRDLRSDALSLYETRLKKLTKLVEERVRSSEQHKVEEEAEEDEDSPEDDTQTVEDETLMQEVTKSLQDMQDRKDTELAPLRKKKTAASAEVQTLRQKQEELEAQLRAVKSELQRAVGEQHQADEDMRAVEERFIADIARFRAEHQHVTRRFSRAQRRRVITTEQKQMTDAEQDAIVDEIKADIRRNVEQEDAIELLNTMADAVRGTLRTNKFVRERYALSLRMDPKVLGYGTVGKDTPFGVFFIYGRRFKGFHVRFRDIARGGLRMVYPSSTDAHALESARQYNEAYNLAFAQQLKNKDIPEGGSKAVVLCDPIVGPVGDMAPRDFIIRKSVKAFSDALLDLNTTDEAVKEKIVDYYGQDELIYLGPDENIIPEDIVWMTNRAAYRGYPVPRAFISSKPDAGFNHKVYGVTSEGVAVFADVALRSQNIDPTKQPFTVKITGGTDGDVAGNVIKILHREYGTNLRVVGICDGTGVIEDPQGLDMGELLRLVDESLPLSSFDDSKITSATGVKHDISTAEGIRARNTMHNRVKSDLFIPAGGRPNTINENNWQDYLDADGKPSSGLIVEGANLFVTPEARQLLFDNAGVVIVKDSSANKCGVVCSSYEIVASMLLETDEFLAVKDELVVEVVDKLRSLARVEAQLLFREYKKDPSSALPPASERISRAITRVHDAVLAHFDNVCDEDQQILFTLIEEHLPPKLRELALDRVHQNVPLAYIRSIVASSLASKIVYREGLQFTEALPESNLGNMALQYLKQEKKVQRLVQDVRSSSLANKDDIADLIARGGVRAGMDTPTKLCIN